MQHPTSIVKLIDQAIRSGLFYIVMILSTILYSGICIMSLPFSYRVRYQIVTFWTKSIIFFLKFICKIRYNVIGLENIPTQAGVIFSKHQSTWETFFLPNIFPYAAIILKKELLYIPFFGWALRALSPIAIDRTKKFSALEQLMREGYQRLQAGQWVIVFPEGTRSTPLSSKRYQIGGAALAVKNQVPLLPIAHNAGLYWPAKKFLKKPGTIQLIIGKAIYGTNSQEVCTQAKIWIEQTVQSLSENSFTNPN